MTKTQIQLPIQEPEQGPMPFSIALSSDELFIYAQLNELSKLLKITIGQKSMMIVTGEAGVGKSTAVSATTDQLPTNKYLVIYLGQDQEGASIWRRLASSLGLRPSISRAHTRLSISQYLNDNLLEKGKDVVLVVDEAHLLDLTTLEDIRLLTNTDFDRSPALTVILLGQLSLRSRVKTAGFEALNQRLRHRYALEGFSEEETAGYIKHRLHVSGWDQEFFAPDAIRQIFLASQGIPREINNYCLSALLKAQNQQLNRIDRKLIKHVLDQRELN
ncbi:MAG: ExeA family protein [Ktedonobacteraceae bacterium]